MFGSLTMDMVFISIYLATIAWLLYEKWKIAKILVVALDDCERYRRQIFFLNNHIERGDKHFYELLNKYNKLQFDNIAANKGN